MVIKNPADLNLLFHQTLEAIFLHFLLASFLVNLLAAISVKHPFTLAGQLCSSQ